MNPLSKSICPGILLVVAAMLFVACTADVPAPYFEDGPLVVHFPNFSADQFKSMKIFEDKEKGIQYSKYLSKGEQPNLVIAREYSRSVYDNLQEGRREVCPPDFLPGLPKKVMTVPTHTEVLNDTSFLLGSMWFGLEEGHIPGERISGTIGWKASLINPETAIYIHFWQEIESISPDSLLLWSLKMREEVVFRYKEGFEEYMEGR